MSPQRSREMRIREFLAAPPFNKRNVTAGEIALFDIALTHDSYANEEMSRTGKRTEPYERLEFLGDAVMELIVCEHIYSSAEQNEGTMTDRKKEIVCNRNISSRVVENGMDIDGVLLVGEGHRGKRTGSNIVEENMRADAFEAVLGAVYLSYGTDEARRIVKEVFLNTSDTTTRQ
jgi:ribonuclease-3